MLIDTSGLLCLLDRSEPFHQKARTEFFAAPRRLTHNYIVAEFIALANARRLARPVALSFMTDLVADPDIETIWVDPTLHADAMAFLVSRPDKSYSLADAVSFIIMGQKGVSEALTTDRHFEQEGLHRLLR